MSYKFKTAFMCLWVLSILQSQAQSKVSSWISTSDKSALLQAQPAIALSPPSADTANTIVINTDQQYQYIDGFGFALTGGSAQHMIRMAPELRKKLITELFSAQAQSIGVSYLRLSIGASDLNDHVFSYDDLPAGETDMTLRKFTLAEDEKDVVPVLKEILAVNPRIKIMGSPWSAPVWMKTNGNIQGGMLQEKYYPVYAQYFVKYIQAMKKHGITIDAITVQNEPFNDGNTPSMQFLAKQELRFIKNHLGPAFRSAGIKTKIVLYDHNCDAPEYPISILTDAAARPFIDGSGFHLYAGPVTAMSQVHDAFPSKNLYFTEMMATARDGSFNVAVPTERIMIGATRNWSRNVLLWNLAANSRFEPHTDNGGCPFCQGAVSIDGNEVTRNLAYYTMGHFSKFLPMGSVRIGSSLSGGVSNVAFKTPSGKIVCVVANRSAGPQSFQVMNQGQGFRSSLPGGAVGTYVW